MNKTRKIITIEIEVEHNEERRSFRRELDVIREIETKIKAVFTDMKYDVHAASNNQIYFSAEIGVSNDISVGVNYYS